MAMKPVTGKLRKGGGKGLSGDALVGKVSQKTIDSIKKLGMTEALKLAGKNGATAGGAAREFQEGVRRMYGAKRLATAKATYAPKPKMGTKTVMAPKGGVKPAAKPATKSKNNSNFGKVVGGLYGAAAVGALVASKGKATGLASKMAPGLAKSVSKSAVGKALFGSGKPLTSKAFAAAKAAPKPNAAKVTVGPKGSFGPTTKSMAKSKLGTPSEYASKAGQASARAGIKTPTADAARAAASKVTKKKAAGASMASNKRK